MPGNKAKRARITKAQQRESAAENVEPAASDLIKFPEKISSMDEYHYLYEQSIAEPEKFWAAAANHFLTVCF